MKEEKLNWDISLIELAYWYLMKKQRTTHIQYTIADLFETCEKILQWSEKGNRFKKEGKIKFYKNRLLMNTIIFKKYIQ